MADTNVDFSTKYSLSSLMNNLLRVNQNALEVMNKLSDITTTDSETVEIEVIDANNQINKVYVPSYGQLKSEINRLDNNIKQLSGIGDSNANVQLEDGSFRKLMLSNLKLEGNSIKRIASPTQFESKSNWFFESFLNPLLYVSFNFTGQIPADTERCKVQRFILNIDTQNKLNIWNNSLDGASDLDYIKFFQLLLKNNITYFLDEDVVDLPPRDIRFYGSFNVLRIIDNLVDDQVDSATFTKRKFKIQLDTLNYNDALSEYSKTQQLKIGDTIVIVGDGTNNNTRFQVTNIDLEAGNIIEVKLLEGYDLLSIGSMLSFYSGDSAPTELEVNIGFNEYTVVFIKPINPVSKIPALEWSPGVAFFTNELQIIDENGNQLNLEQYYKEQVVDFGAYIYNLAKDGIPPSTLAEKPLAPNASSTDFQVLQINNHITDVSRIDKIKKLQSEKTSIKAELDSLNESIKKKKADINTKKYTSDAQRATDQSELNDLIQRSSSSSQLLKSAVDEIISLAEGDNLEGITPKYRIKGFWPIPDPVASTQTEPQEVVQFKIQYRYVSQDGGANQPNQITYTDNNGTQRRGTFSTWQEMLTPVRKRVKDSQTGQFVWQSPDVENADEINANQLEIPIRQGEGVEFRIKSLSEAGWPTNPAESDWTDTIRVDFPDELVSTNEITTIVEQAKLASESLELTTTLQDSGVIQHISGQFTQNETFYAHPAQSIASGFLTNEQNVINLFEKLSEFETRIRLIEEAITGEKGLLQVVIIDDSQQEYVVKPNTVLQLFAGNYRDQVKDLTVKKGVIIAKNYLLKLTNVNASSLEMYARQYGNFTQVVDSSTVGGSGYDSTDEDYNTTRRYDAVPLGPSNLSVDYTSVYTQFVDLPYQSGQVKGQYINNRYKNITSTANLYGNIVQSGSTGGTAGWPAATLPEDATNGFPNPNAVVLGTALSDYTKDEYTLSSLYPFGAPTNAATEFIWAGSFTGTTPDVVATTAVTNWNDGIYVHKDHPFVENGYWPAVTGTPGPGNTGAAGPAGVRNSGYAPLVSSEITSGSRKQKPYFYNTGSTASFPYKEGRVGKIAFEEEDQYLLGPNSCGAYLFMSPPNNTGAINVEGSNKLSIKTISFGSENSVAIPIVFQYRMTDYFGDGAVGIGNIGGDITGTTNQIEYTKTIGIDIYSNIDERFSFDLEITSRYRSKSLQLQQVPSRDLENVVDDLTKTIKFLNPRLTNVNGGNGPLRGGGSSGGGGLLGSISTE
jgi:hypothetical protein